MGRNHGYWSRLPEELLTVIGELFQSLDDIIRFRSVCSSFRSSLSLPPKTLLPDSAQRNSFPMDIPIHHDDFILTEATVYAIEPLIKISNTHETTQTWLIKVEDSNVGQLQESNFCQLQIKDPLTGFRFPYLRNVLPKSLNLLDYRVKEITKAYKLEIATIPEGKSRAEVCDLYRQGGGLFAKTVACTCLDEFVVMGIYDGKLFVWRDGNDNLTSLDIAHDDFQDIICHDKKFYALRRWGQVIAFDSTSFNVTQELEPPRNGTIGCKNYLVNSSNDLLLVYHYLNLLDKWNYGVCKLNEEKTEWVRIVNGLEDRVLFVSHYDSSFSVSAQEFSGCKGNCIYFCDYILPLFCYNHPGFFAWIFNLKDNTYSRLSAVPGYSKVFWPPPTWLQGHARSAPPHRPRD